MELSSEYWQNAGCGKMPAAATDTRNYEGTLSKQVRI